MANRIPTQASGRLRSSRSWETGGHRSIGSWVNKGRSRHSRHGYLDANVLETLFGTEFQMSEVAPASVLHNAATRPC